MTTITDFGRHIPGAAKHRNRDWALQAAGIGTTLAEIFPEPDWQELIDAGAPARNVGLARALRDAIGGKPQKESRLRNWIAVARATAMLAEDLTDPGAAEITPASARAMRVEKYLPKADLYREMGHAQSLRKFAVVPHEGRIVAVEDRRVRASGNTIEELARALSDHLDRTSGVTKVRWYMRPIDPRRKTGPVMILAGLSGGTKIDIEEAPDEMEAQRRVRQEEARLRAILDRIKAIPSERGTRNADRVGPARRTVDVTPAMLVGDCRLDGLQFGNSLSDSERQNEMNQAYDAIMDMAEVLGGKFGFTTAGPRPGLAFGARGKGGVHAAKAHYEPGLHVINLTRRAGAGSLGHEWFHATDDGSPMFRRLDADLALLPVTKRSKQLDATRSSPYYALPREISARCFETWLKFRLEEKGILNDYLANIISEGAWAVSDYVGRGRYPYPTAEEMPAIDQAFSALFGVAPAGPRQAPEAAPVAPPVATREAPSPAETSRPHRPPCPAMSEDEPGVAQARRGHSSPEAPPAADDGSTRWMDELEF